MMRLELRKIGWPLVFVLALGALFAACQEEGGEIRLVPDYPLGESAFLDGAGVVQIVVELYPAGARGGEPPFTEILAREEKLHIGSLAAGPWIAVARGIDSGGAEVVHGESQPFVIGESSTTEVHIFMGLLQQFNRVGLGPADVAESIAALQGLAATPYTDADGAQRILVTGGFREGSPATAEAFLIDPAALTATRLEATMSKARLGHRAIAVEPPGRAPLVVIAEGGSDPIESLEIFDTATGRFRTVAVPCGTGPYAGIVPALTRSAAGTLVPSGRVILPGASLCVVDPYGEEAAETRPSATGVAPVLPALAAVNAAGQLVVVDGEGAVSVTSAVEDGLPADACTADAESASGRIAARAGGALVALGERDRFAVIGGTAPDGGAPLSDWAVIVVSNCTIARILEGDADGDDAIVDPVPLDLSGPVPNVDLVVTGGGESPTAASAVLIADGPADAPLWYAEAIGHTPALRAPRRDHAVATLTNRSAWALGGGAGAEIFVKGDGAPPLGAVISGFASRDPVLTTMTVLDSTSAAEELIPLIQNGDEDGLVPTLFGLSAIAHVYLVGNAERGVGDGLNGSDGLDLWEGDYCIANAVGNASPIEWGAVMGDTSEIDIPEGIDPAGNPNEAVQDALAANTNAMNGMTVSALDGEAPLPPPNLAEPPEAGVCQWRQYFRVGLDGLALGAQDATFSGVNVLILAVAADDCSQGAYPGATDVANLPEAATSCTEEAMDGYLGLPPQGFAQDGQFADFIGSMVWDIDDLVVGIVTPAELEGALPRRLAAVLAELEAWGAHVVALPVAEVKESPPFVERLAALADTIAARNVVQTCVPSGIGGEVAWPFAEDVGLFLPLDDDDELAGEMAAEMQALVAARCRVFRVVSADPTGGAGSKRQRVVGVDDSWKIGIDTDGRAGCDETGWTLYIDPEIAAPLQGELRLQCTAD